MSEFLELEEESENNDDFIFIKKESIDNISDNDLRKSTNVYEEKYEQSISNSNLEVEYKYKPKSLQELHSEKYINNLPPRQLHSFESYFCKIQKHNHNIPLIKTQKLCKVSKCPFKQFKRPCRDTEYGVVYNFLYNAILTKLEKHLFPEIESGEEEETYVRKGSELVIPERPSFTFQYKSDSTVETSSYLTSERTLSYRERMEDAPYSHTIETIELTVPRMLNRILRGPRRHVSIKHSLGFYLRKSLEINSLKTIQICGISRETFNANYLLTRAIRLAYGLQRIGLLKNQVVVISSRNCTYIDEILLAVISLGAVCLFLDPELDEGSLLRHLQEVKPSLAMCHGDSLTRFSRCLQIVCPTIKIIYFLERNYYHAPQDSPLIIPYGKLLSKHIGPPFLPDEFYNFSHEPAFIILIEDTKDGTISSYSHTQITLIKMLLLARENFYHLPADEKITLTYSTPLTIPQIIYRLLALDQAMTNVVIPRLNEFLLLQSIQEYQVNTLLLRTDELRRLVKFSLFPLYNKCSPLRHVHFFGDYLPCCIYKTVQSQFRIQLVHFYSLPEVAIIFEPLYFGCCRRGTAGILAPNVKGVIINQKGERLGPYQKGELWINPGRRHLARGLDKSWGRRVTSTAWICTGDLAFYDPYGYFYIKGKLGLEFKYKSKKVDPVNIETVLYFHPTILEAVVLTFDFIFPWHSFREPKRICPSKQNRLKKYEFEKMRGLYTCLSSDYDICSCVCADKPYCGEYCSTDSFSLDTRRCWDEPSCSLLECIETCECPPLFGEDEIEEIENKRKYIKKVPRTKSLLPPDCKLIPCELHSLSTWCPCENLPKNPIEMNSRLIAYVIRSKGEPIVSDKEILDYLNVELPAYKDLLKRIQWVEHIPKNVNGEILRNYLQLYSSTLDHGHSATTL